jgi:hypothetical protein
MYDEVYSNLVTSGLAVKPDEKVWQIEAGGITPCEEEPLRCQSVYDLSKSSEESKSNIKQRLGPKGLSATVPFFTQKYLSQSQVMVPKVKPIVRNQPQILQS